MNRFFENIVANAMNIRWEGPAMFMVIVLAVFAVSRQYHILLLMLLVIVIGWGAEDMMITNIETSQRVVSVPLLVYITGGALVVILSLVAFMKSAIK